MILSIALFVAGNPDMNSAVASILNGCPPSVVFSESPWNANKSVSAVVFLIELFSGRATGMDAYDLLGAEDQHFTVGRLEYCRYARAGFDLIRIEDHVVRVQRIPPRIPADISKAEKNDLGRLQGVWEEPGGALRVVFDGRFLTFYPSGIAPTWCYEIDTRHRPKRIRLFWPVEAYDPRWFFYLLFNLQDTSPGKPYGTYEFVGEQLVLKLQDHAGFMRDGPDGKALPTRLRSSQPRRSLIRGQPERAGREDRRAPRVRRQVQAIVYWTSLIRARSLSK